jgi:hypothetical protein
LRFEAQRPETAVPDANRAAVFMPIDSTGFALSDKSKLFDAAGLNQFSVVATIVSMTCVLVFGDAKPTALLLSSSAVIGEAQSESVRRSGVGRCE